MAEIAPEQGMVALKLSNYRDWQPGLDRVKVDAPSLYVLAPLDAHWSLEGSAVNDAVSGASPRFHSAVSGASKMDDSRTAGDLKLTHYAERQAWSVGVASSGEHDYRSNTLSGEWRVASEDNNRTWNLGLAYSDDAIGSTNDPTLDEHRRTWQFAAGVTQAWSPVDLVQLNLGASIGRGHFSDPYKFPDARPREREQYTALLRWNHHVEALQATLRTSWRLYDDSYGVRAHTLDAAWVQPVAPGWTLTPMLRYTTQRAARFYYDPVYDPVLGAPFPPGFGNRPYYSADQRLSAFGAATAGLRVDWAIDSQWKLDLAYERYEQRAAWRVGGDGSPGLAPFSARWWQLGVSRSF
ncbi:DUF3570 domain-containing protein [Ideonella sp.]|uniref:DUF3570 domain-containing protein n=1 Tax=Ideonella sp. TaxID=1929293 RepID=UPI002B49D0C1|nr:DUF3570 domain-containing protein [Ideonella sp.]HJV71030.1 DUF3570 domain-containing protein [Ideonella sp.]